MWSAAEGPTVADWLAAWGQVGGAVGTTAAVAVALWLGFRDRRWRRADQADRDVGQARLVTVDLQEKFGGLMDDDSLDTELHVVLTNNSTEPIVDVEVLELRCESAPGLGWEHRSYGDPYERDQIPVVNSGAIWQSEVNYTSPGGGRIPAPGADHIVTIGFTDARGLRWSRTGTRAPVRRDLVAARRFRLRLPWTWS